MKSPPRKGEGAMLPAPIPKLTGLALDNSGSGVAQACTHSVPRTERLPDSHPHFARLRCVIFGCHLRWLPRPETIERRTLNAFRLARLAMRSDLTDWERQFIRSVGGKKHLSAKQAALYIQTTPRYLER